MMRQITTFKEKIITAFLWSRLLFLPGLWASSVCQVASFQCSGTATAAGASATGKVCSIKALASVLLPASVNHRCNHRQHAQPQEGEEEGEEELQPAHAFILDLHCTRRTCTGLHFLTFKGFIINSDGSVVMEMTQAGVYLETGWCCQLWGWWPPPPPLPQHSSALSAGTTSWRWCRGYLQQHGCEYGPLQRSSLKLQTLFHTRQITGGRRGSKEVSCR